MTLCFNVDYDRSVLTCKGATKNQLIVDTVSFWTEGSENQETQLSLVSNIQWYVVLFTVRVAVKLPLMWKLWSHEDINKF